LKKRWAAKKKAAKKAAVTPAETAPVAIVEAPAPRKSNFTPEGRQKLKLQVNQQKSAVARPWARKYLGFSFTSAGISKRRIAPKAVDRFKERIRELTGRNRG
jgi:hypothetical protein